MLKDLLKKTKIKVTKEDKGYSATAVIGNIFIATESESSDTIYPWPQKTFIIPNQTDLGRCPGDRPGAL
jgi:hypothetical protein